MGWKRQRFSRGHQAAGCCIFTWRTAKNARLQKPGQDLVAAERYFLLTTLVLGWSMRVVLKSVYRQKYWEVERFYMNILQLQDLFTFTDCLFVLWGGWKLMEVNLLITESRFAYKISATSLKPYLGKKSDRSSVQRVVVRPAQLAHLWEMLTDCIWLQIFQV